eukprot:284816275_3
MICCETAFACHLVQVADMANPKRRNYELYCPNIASQSYCQGVCNSCIPGNQSKEWRSSYQVHAALTIQLAFFPVFESSCCTLIALAAPGLPEGAELHIVCGTRRARDRFVALISEWRDAATYGFTFFDFLSFIFYFHVFIRFLIFHLHVNIFQNRRTISHARHRIMVSAAVLYRSLPVRGLVRNASSVSSSKFLANIYSMHIRMQNAQAAVKHDRCIRNSSAHGQTI